MISAELLPRVDADVMLIYGFGKPPPEVLGANPRLEGLGAVKSGRAHFLQDLSLSASSVLSIPHGLDALLPFLEGATSG